MRQLPFAFGLIAFASLAGSSLLLGLIRARYDSPEAVRPAGPESMRNPPKEWDNAADHAGTDATPAGAAQTDTADRLVAITAVCESHNKCL